MLYGRVYKLCCTGHFCFFVWFFVIFVTFQGGFRHWDPFQTNPCAKSYKMNVSRASGTPCGSSYGHFCFFVWFFVIFVTFQGGFRHWDPFQTNPCAKSYKMNVSRASGTPCGSSYGHFCFFIKFLKKSVLGGPTSKKITFFSFCARALCAGLVRMSCAPSCAPKANLSIEHRNQIQ